MRINILALALGALTLPFAFNAHAQFLRLKSYGIGTGLRRILKTDLNNDNKLDVVGIGGVNGTPNVTALLGDGKGAFSAPIISPITGINNVTGDVQTVGDFNNDGIPDFAFVGTDPVTGAPALGIMLGKGNGSFDAPRETVLPAGEFPFQIAAGDFIGNGKMDLVLNTSSNVVVLPGKGNGTFGTPINSIIGLDSRCLAVGDFNNDGKLDITVGISVALGNGDGTFQSPLPVTDGGCNVAVVDLNHDGNLDLITGTNSPGKTVHVYLGNGTGNFNHFAAYNTSNSGNASFAVADFSGNGHPDIAVLSLSDDDVTILLNNGSGAFKIGETFNGGANDLVAGDFNSDHKQDLVVSSGGINVLIGKGNGTFVDNLAQNKIGDPNRGIAADFNGDHKLDLLAFDPNSALLLGNGNGTFQSPLPLPASCQNQVMSVAVGDFNNDHKLDLAMIAGNGLAICLGNGDGTFQNATFIDQGISHDLVTAGDFNHDGKLDLAVSDQGGISILLGNGDGTFQSGIATALNASFPVFTVGDFNHDGKLDVAAITGTTISVLLGKGDGTFQTPITSNNTNAVFVTAGDVNNDGKLDLVTANSTVSNTVSVLLGNGDGTFKAPVFYPDLGATQLTLGDFNRDGKLDIAFTEHTGFLDVLLNKGDGTFKSAAKSPTFAGKGWVVLGDFDRDGALDLLDLGFIGGPTKLVVFLNTKGRCSSCAPLFLHPQRRGSAPSRRTRRDGVPAFL